MLRSRLASLMADNDVRQDELHAATGISKATLSNIANNKTSAPQYSTIETLAMFFNVSPKNLFEYVPYKYEIKLTDEPQVKELGHMTSFTGLELQLTTNRMAVRNMPFEVSIYKEPSMLTEISFLTNNFDHFGSVGIDDDIFTGFLEELTPAFLKQFTTDLSLTIKRILGPVLVENGLTGTLLLSMGGYYEPKYQFTLKL